MNTLPVLYSFRRCPYAMRARLAILVSEQQVELREIVLRDKAQAFLETSPSATVPCLKDGETVLDESLDIMIWALQRNDPEAWLSPGQPEKSEMMELIAECDGPFKRHLDRYKYDTRYEDADKLEERAAASVFLQNLNQKLAGQAWLFGASPCLADYAILPFVRQFANSDRDWFDAQDWDGLIAWLIAFETSGKFQAIMPKFAKWHPADPPLLFPA